MKQFQLGQKDNINTPSLKNKSKDKNSINESLKNFDELPNSSFVRLPVVQALYACSAATVWRMVKRGAVPAPCKITQNISAWNVAKLRESLSAYVPSNN